jgi:hypothetical protein
MKLYILPFKIFVTNLLTATVLAGYLCKIKLYLG